MDSMAPSQALALVGLDQEGIAEPPLKSFTEMDNGNISEVKDDIKLRCTNNCEDNTFDIDALLDQVEETSNFEVDITNFTDTSVRLVQEEDPDATEYSSSFGGTISGSEAGSKLNSSDAEVDSHFQSENEASTIFYGVNRLFPERKKRLTAHWRRYIRPLMWRCKWIELQVKGLQSQALKYDKEILGYAGEKQARAREVALECSVARSMPLYGRSRRKEAMKRRKRTRVEEMVDIPSYMSHHNIFAYYEHKKFETDGVSIDDDCGNQVMPVDKNNSADEFGFDSEWTLLEFKDGNSSLEQILWSIEALLSRVENLKTRLDKVAFRNAGSVSSMNNLSNFLSCDHPTSSALSPTISPASGEQMPLGALYTPPGHLSDYEIGELVMPESAVSSLGDATPLPDTIESTAGIYSVPGRTLHQPQIEDSCEDIADDILIHNQSTEEELQNFGKVTQEPFEEHEEEKVAPPQVGEPESALGQEHNPQALEPEAFQAREGGAGKSLLKSALVSEFRIPRSKRKWVERKAASGRWNRGKVYKRRSSRGTGGKFTRGDPLGDQVANDFKVLDF